MLSEVGGGVEPPQLAMIARATARLGFTMSCSEPTGRLLAFLAARASAGALLELGTGTGYGTAWLAAGMGPAATLTTVESDRACLRAARLALGADERIHWVESDAADWLTDSVHPSAGRRFDVIFADCWPGKFSQLDEALSLLADGGVYVIDDLDPQPSWPPGHQEKVDDLLAVLHARTELAVLTLPVATGILLAARR